MKKTSMCGLAAVLALMFLAPAGEAGITRVTKRLNMIDFYAGGSMITGKYQGLGSDNWNTTFGVPFASPKVSGGDLYNSTYHVGFDYGQLRDNRILYAFGFRYTRVDLADSVNIPFDDPENLYFVRFGRNGPSVNLYDVDFNLNYFFTDASASTFAPYIGLGLKAGFMVFSTDARDPETGAKYADENELKFTTSLNFGADFRVWSAPSGRSFVAVSSVNSWDVLASGSRPRYLNIGGALKYYFRP